LVGEPSKFTLTLSGTLIPRGITGVKPIGITIGINRFIAAIDGMGWVTLKDGTKVWGRKMEAPGVQHQDLLPEQNSKEVAFRFLWNVENNPWPRGLKLDLYSTETLRPPAPQWPKLDVTYSLDAT